MARGRFVPNPALFRELASSELMHSLLLERAQAGANAARAIAPVYSGPTWGSATRHGEYKASIYSAANLRPSGWRAEFAAASPWALHVEFGTGRGQGRERDARGRYTSARQRPQKGSNRKFRVLGRALDALRST